MLLSDKPPYQVVQEEHRKVSRDCFVSYLWNKYSVPWRFAGMDARLLIQDGKMRVEVGGELACEHELRASSGEVVRVRDHFAGLYKEVCTMLDEAERTDAEEDVRFGDRRGDELPAELARQETRIKRIREAMAALEERARSEAEGKGRARTEDRDAPKENAEGKGQRSRRRRTCTTSPTPRAASCPVPRTRTPSSRPTTRSSPWTRPTRS